jgi:hypothetical protein
VSLTSAPAPHDVARRRGHYMAIRTSRCLRQLSRYVPASETWQRVGSYPERREGAISAAAYGENQC